MNILDVLNHKSDAEEMEPEALPTFSLAGGELISKANIATDLEPRTKAYVQKGSRAYIVGNDGINVSTDNYPWVNLLRQWLEKGCDISYLLQNPEDKTLEKLRSLVQGKDTKRGRLQVFRIDGDAKKDSSTEEYLKQWETFHFAVFENPKQLWIETCHEPGKTWAHDCYYFSPKTAEQTPLLEVYKSRFDHVIENCGEPAL